MEAKIVITVLGVLLIVFINWYFFFSGRKSQATAARRKQNFQEVKIVVKGGYTPDVIVVKKGIPVRLNFYRNETADCSDTIVFGDFNIRRPLPAFQTTAIEFTPEREGKYIFTCGMGMLRGKLIVR
jgi:plastocyanin domain-containing protein